jgi:hypothetical protein
MGRGVIGIPRVFLCVLEVSVLELVGFWSFWTRTGHTFFLTFLTSLFLSGYKSMVGSIWSSNDVGVAAAVLAKRANQGLTGLA